MAGAAALGAPALAPAKAQAASPPRAQAVAGKSAFYRSRIFFTNQLLFDTLSQASERIFPADETGPGAIELKAPFFIDNQLAGAYGSNAREYVSGPFEPGVPGQGGQSALLRKDIFLQGLAALNAQSEKTYKKTFPGLSDAEKDQILTLCEAGDIPTEGFSSSQFFSLLKSAVLAGVYADPIYGGNDGMQGWEMKNYPGSQPAYLDVVSSETFQTIPPASLADT